jgi:hypothetical protein
LISLARICGAFCDQHWLTAFRHHSALARDARTGCPPTSANTGLLCDEGRIRAAIQLLRSIGTSNVSVRSVPSACSFCVATGAPLTMISTGTSMLVPIRARSRSQ